MREVGACARERDSGLSDLNDLVLVAGLRDLCRANEVLEADDAEFPCEPMLCAKPSSAAGTSITRTRTNADPRLFLTGPASVITVFERVPLRLLPPSRAAESCFV